MNHINALFKVVDHNLATINGTMDYDRITDTLIALANSVHNTDDEIDWEIGEFGMFCLSDLIVGAYWHFTEWHAGQTSKSYAALCALGQVFNPGMSDVEEDNEAYILLNELADS